MQIHTQQVTITDASAALHPTSRQSYKAGAARLSIPSFQGQTRRASVSRLARGSGAGGTVWFQSSCP